MTDDGHTKPEPVVSPDRSRAVEGPFLEYDRDGNRTGESYYRCQCGREALRRRDLVCGECSGAQL